jgi:hypothetical protein
MQNSIEVDPFELRQSRRPDPILVPALANPNRSMHLGKNRFYAAGRVEIISKKELTEIDVAVIYDI